MINDKYKHRQNKGAVNKAGAFFAAAWRTIKRYFSALILWLRGEKPGSARHSSPASSETVVFDCVKDSDIHARSQKVHSPHTVPHISKEHLSGEGKEHITMFRARKRRDGVVINVALTSFKLILIVIFMFGAAGFGTVIGIAKAYMETTPTLNTEKIEEQAETSYLYDCNGNVMTAYSGTENRDWANLDEIPVTLQHAVVAIEDVRFYYHNGVDFKRLFGAFISNLMNNNVQGGSTITQQLIKNRMLTTERTYKRKIQEAYLAMQLEETYDKEEILEAYMNTIFLGESNYGVKAAAKDYFGKSLDQLTLRESAMLAGITQYPYSYNPRRCYYVKKDPTPVEKRTDKVLTAMYKAGYINKDEYEYALHDTVTVQEHSEVTGMYEHPYFVEYAIYDVITHFLKQRGLQDTKENRAAIETEIRTSGYQIYTTMDPAVQSAVEDSLRTWEKYPKLEDESASVKRTQNADGSITETKEPQAAAVVVDHITGQLKAVVGGRDKPEAKKTLNRTYQTTMPVGSSIKPIAVYAPAIDKGNSDGFVVPNMPVKIEGWDDGGGKGYPAGGSSKYGPITLHNALVNSLNSATAFTLLNKVGIDDSFNYLVNMGINPKHIQKTAAGLSLGTSGITPIEMAGAYATIANGGEYLEPLSFTVVKDKDGNVILNADEIREERRVFKESTAFIVSQMLVDAVDHGTGTKAKISGMTIGGKTGTNQDAKGVFFAGISPYYTATLWIGHDDYKPLDSQVYASSSAAPLWRDFMSKILEGKQDAPIINKSLDELGLEKVDICSVSGLRATPACAADPNHGAEGAYFLKGTAPIEECNVHYLLKTCPETGKLATPYCEDAQGPLEAKSYIMLPPDSIYWQFTSADQRLKYMPNLIATPASGTPLSDIMNDPSAPEYYQFFCDKHTLGWWQEQTSRTNAVNAANAQINVSNGVLSNPAYVMSYEDKTSLSGKISELQQLIADSTSTSGAIEQKTYELESLTSRLVTLYTPATPLATSP